MQININFYEQKQGNKGIDKEKIRKRLFECMFGMNWDATNIEEDCDKLMKAMFEE